MAYTGIHLWAGSSTPLTKLPSPIEVQVTNETIWDEDAGRSPSTGNMIGTVVTKKNTYAIKWGILSYADLTTIRNAMSDDFFYFGVGSSAPATPNKYYRSEISYDYVQADDTYYKDVSVQVIQK